MKIEGITTAPNERMLQKSGIQGGAIAGFCLALIAIVFRKTSGFSDLPTTLFSDLWPVIILNGTLAGAGAGFLCSRFGIQLSRNSNRNKIFKSFFLFLSGFIVSVLVQQLSARNALRAPVWNESLGRLYGGPLGEPNFETIATGVIGGIYFLSLANALSSIQQRESVLLTSIKTTIPAIVAWCAVYSVYFFLTTSHLVSYAYKPWGMAAVFIVDFPHPERVVLYIVFCFLYTLIVIHTVKRNHKVVYANGSHKDQLFLDQIFMHIEKNLNTPGFGPEQLSKSLGISKGHLNRKLNDLANMTTTKYILSARLEKAARLLQQDYDTVSRIAYHVGFNNLSYFNKSFKQQFGLTPTEYRKNK